MTPHLPGGFQFLNGDGFGVYEHVRLYVSGDQFVEAGSPMNSPSAEGRRRRLLHP